MKPNKKLMTFIIVVGTVCLLALAGTRAVESYQIQQVQQEPLSSIDGRFIGKAVPGTELKRTMFEVTGQTQSGRIYTLNDYDIDIKKVPLHGSNFVLTIIYHEFEKKIDIPITREPLVEYSIGYPEPDDAKATVYTNGDLEFTGTGNTLKFSQSSIPWKSESYTHVYFKPGIEPENIDYWFLGNSDLIYCDALPKSIESMRGTFRDADSLEATPDFFQCTELRVSTECFSGCDTLNKTDDAPINLVAADAMYRGCVNLTTPPNLMKSSLVNISGMFDGCTGMISAPEIPETVKEMESTFEGCENIYSATKFPELVENISNAYKGCTSLKDAARIPKSVLYYQGCYADCINLYGSVSIDTDTDKNSGVFAGAAQSGRKLILNGQSQKLVEIQQDANNQMIALETEVTQ